MSHTSNSCSRQKNEACYVTCDDGNMKDLFCSEAGVWDIQDPCSSKPHFSSPELKAYR